MRIKLYFIGLILLFVSDWVSVYGMDIAKRQHSLSLELDKASDPVRRLEILKEVSFISSDLPSGSYWLKRMLDEAENHKDIASQDWAIRYLARFYFNESNLDSLTYYATLSDSLAQDTQVFSDNYYDTRSFLSQYLAWDGNTEKAVELATGLYVQAKKSGNEYGILCGCETLGIINQRIGRDSIAVDFMKEGITLLRKLEGQKRFLVQMLNNIIESELKLNRLEDANEHLGESSRLIEEMQADDLTFPYMRCFVLLQSYYINLYVRTGNASEALAHINQIQPEMLIGLDQLVYIQYLFGSACYYQLIRDNDRALEIINKLVGLDPSLEVLKKKAEILFETGNTREAALTYQKALRLNEDMQTENFNRQLTQLHSLHEFASLELQVKELQVKELELDAKRQQLRWTLSLTGILLVFIIIGIYIYRHTNKLKNELAKDKQILQESEEDLRVARDQAQESDRVKSLFLSNMSHEIRTPLNAIVGFSQVLEAEIEGNKELEDYTNMITSSSNLLLNLVNDILDISRLESEKYRFSFADENLADCCRETLRNVEHRLMPGVELRFLPEKESFVLCTDKLRLQQVLINLVGNATKFTISGYIELAFHVEEDNNLVRFTVTDTGCGIPVDKQDDIFERFEKLNECVQGTGLGLSICRIIAERLGGEVILDKEYTGGAQFVFTHSLLISTL